MLNKVIRLPHLNKPKKIQFSEPANNIKVLKIVKINKNLMKQC